MSHRSTARARAASNNHENRRQWSVSGFGRGLSHLLRVVLHLQLPKSGVRSWMIADDMFACLLFPPSLPGGFWPSIGSIDWVLA